MKKSILIFAAIVLASTFYAIKFSHHPIAWLIGLIASIPIFAAIAGAFEKNDK
jgi:cadmium resistance protein CadD (predicted permease)